MWKCIFALSLVCFAATITCQAQVSVGVQGYLQNIGASGDTPDDRVLSAALGFGAALSGSWMVTRDVEITLGTGMDTRKVSISEVLPRTDSLVELGTMSLSSYAIPIGVRVYGASQTWCFTSGVLLRIRDAVTIRMVDEEEESDVSDSFSQTEIGVYLGVGYSIGVGAFRFLPELRYEQGISDLITTSSIQGLPPSPVLRASGFSLRLTAEFVLGGEQ